MATRLVGSQPPVNIAEGGAIAPTRVVTTTNITLVGGAPNTYDGIALAANNRILVAGQTIQSENGVYTITALGGGADGTWTRSLDANTSVQFRAGMPVWVSEGNTNSKSFWYLDVNDPVTLGVTNLVFTKYQSFQYKLVNTTPYNMDVNDSELGVDSTLGPINIVLPLASTVKTGRLFAITDIVATAGANNITLTANPANSINGAPTFVMNTNRASVIIYTDQTNWFVRSGYNIDGVGIFQPLDAGLTSISALVTAADTMIYTTALDTYTTATLTAAGRALVDDATAGDQRTTLGLVIGTDVQAQDATLQSLSALGTVADRTVYTTALDTWAETPLTAAGRALIDDATAGDQRTTLGLAIGTDVQAQDATLQSISTLGTVADRTLYTTALDTWAETPLTAAGRALIDDATAGDQRTTLGLAIGTDVQAQDATLQSLSALGTVADRIAYTTALDTWAETPLTAAGRAIIDDATAGDQRTTLGLVIGTDVQAQDATLQSLSALGTVADRIAYTTALDTWAETPLTAAGRAIIDDASAADQRTTLGLGTIATQDSNNVTITGGSVTGITDLAVADGGTGLSSGTSGGILGYTAAGTLASSIALTANALVLGAGAGATPTPMGSLGTTTTLLHGNAAGAPTFGAVVPADMDLTQAYGFSGNMGFYGAATAAQQVSGANLTNNVTIGGVNDTIADFVDLTTYANDAATIRNDIYQLARKLKQVNDALRVYGLLT